MNKGFTLIEVLVSLVILSMIAVISSNILQSSLELERTSSQRLSSARSLNFSSILIRRDIRQIINVPLKDFYGNPMSATLIGNNEDKRIMFNTKIKFLPRRAGERYASALTNMNLSNKVYKYFGKIKLKDYVKKFIEINN